MLSLAVASDLHFEFHRKDPQWLPPLPTACDVLVLAGDIGVGNGATQAVFRIAEALPDTNIVWVAGNHEFYQQHIGKQLDKYRRDCAKHSRVFFLENEAVEIEGYRFLGCTLWSGFDCLGEKSIKAAMLEAQACISDFSLIRTAAEGRPFAPTDAAHRYVESYRWLEAQLAGSEPARTVVVSHFPPCRETRHQGLPVNPLTPYFQANCDELVSCYQPVLWLYGHNHWTDNITLGNTRLISNQLGYPSEDGQIPVFETECVTLD